MREPGEPKGPKVGLSGDRGGEARLAEAKGRKRLKEASATWCEGGRGAFTKEREGSIKGPR